MKYKHLVTALFLLFLGSALLIIENRFYQYVDESGLLHESLFLPLGLLVLILGTLVLFVLVTRHLIKRRRKKQQRRRHNPL